MAPKEKSVDELKRGNGVVLKSLEELKRRAGGPAVDRLPKTTAATIPGRVSDAQKALDVKLIDAVKRGDLEEVSDALKSGADKNARDFLGRTAMICAVLARQEEVIRMLVTEKADPNLKDLNGWNAVINLVIFNPPDTKKYSAMLDSLEFLLSKGAEVNSEDVEHRTALDYAREYENTGAIRLLEKYGARGNDPSP